MIIILAIILLLAAVSVVVWALNSMIRYGCPECSRVSSDESVVMPVLPGFIWWCPGCSGTWKKEELVEKESPESPDRPDF